MLRWIFIFLVAYVLVRMLRFLLHSPSKSQKKNHEQLGKAGEMIACSACDTYVLKENALQREGNYFCCEKCVKEKP